MEVRLILKGGGCENKNIQYSVPCTLDNLGRADRNLEGVRKCILHCRLAGAGSGMRARSYWGVHRQRPRPWI